MKPEEIKEVVQELYFSMLNAGMGLISEHLAKKCAEITIQAIQEDRERLFHQFGIGFMGNAVARNDFSKHSLSIECKKLKQELQEL